MKRKLMTLLLILSLVTPLVSATLHARPVYAENKETTEHMDEAAEEATTTEETPTLDGLPPSPATVEESPSEATELRTLDETQVLQEVPVVTRTELLPELELLAVYATGWTNQALEIELFLLEKMSGNEAAIKKLEGRTAASDFWTEITGSRTWLMRENGTLYLRCEAADGQTLNHELFVSNIDTGKPSVNASINNALVSIRATDDISGVASIYVNDYPFTDLKSGNLDLLLQDYDTYFEELMIYAVDHAGNRSLTYSLKNPYYKKTDSTQMLATPSTTERPAVITPSPVTDAKGTLTDETTDGKGTVTEDTVIPTPTGYQTNVPTPTLAPDPTAPDETRPFRTDTDQEPTLAGSADQAAKEFLSIKTKSGKIFYLIIDRMKSNDNVYLVTEVDEADLMHFTDTDSSPNVVALPHPDSQVQVSLPKPSDEKPVPLEPIVTFLWSEHEEITDGMKMPLSQANRLMEELDTRQRNDREQPDHDGLWYYKTSFQIDYVHNGEHSVYSGRQDIGDGDGSLIQHIQQHADHYLNDASWQRYLADKSEAEREKANQDLRSMRDEIVPYFNAHCTLSQLEQRTNGYISELEALPVTERTDRINGSLAYYADVQEYVRLSRQQKNLTNEPQMPEFPQMWHYVPEPVEHAKELDLDQDGVPSRIDIDDHDSRMQLPHHFDKRDGLEDKPSIRDRLRASKGQNKSTRNERNQAKALEID